MIELNGTWKLREVSRYDGLSGASNPQNVILAAVPGSLYGSLPYDTFSSHPYFGENEQRSLELSAHDYAFSRHFTLSELPAPDTALVLVCEGIDTLADVSVNGIHAGSCSNMHRIYRFDITDSVREGDNEISVTIFSPLKYVRQMDERKPVWGVTSTTIPGYQYLRKAHCQFGWDWGPQLPDSGIFRSIYIEKIQYAGISSLRVEQDNTRVFDDGVRETSRSSYLRIHVENTFLNPESARGGISLRLRLTDPDGETVHKERTEAAPKQILMVEIPSPRLWWPNGYGEQALYHLKVQLLKGREVLDTRECRIGIRDFTVVRKRDQWGESFTFQINKACFFAKGANYIPEDAILGRRTPDRTRKLLEDCVRSHFNCIRVWGGGIYPDDWFFDLCDELGLIVWQDFMFACGVYELDEEMRENIRQECIDNIRRLRNHPSLGLWCGNNEMESAWESWGIPQDQRLRQDYIEIFERLIPQVLKAEDPERFYWPSSPSSGGGFVDPSSEARGDAHYWDVWHGSRQLFEAIEKKYFRFFSEFGFEALPDKRTLEAVIEPRQMNLSSAQMESHQKCENGNAILMYYLARYYPIPSGIDLIIYATQCLQSDYLEMAVRHLRSHEERCSGSIYWQLNDCWPTISWSTIDYYGRWKGAQYVIRRSFEPLIAYAEPDESGKCYLVYVSNDSPRAAEADVIARIIDQNQGVMVQKTGTVRVKAFSSTCALRICLPEPLLEDRGGKPATALPSIARRNCYISYTIQSTISSIGGGIRLFCAPKHFCFQDPELEGTIVGGKNGYKIRVSACHYARRVEVYFEGIDVLLSDNFFDIEPAISRWVAIEEIRTDQDITMDILQKKLRLRSNYDLGWRQDDGSKDDLP